MIQVNIALETFCLLLLLIMLSFSLYSSRKAKLDILFETMVGITMLTLGADVTYYFFADTSNINLLYFVNFCSFSFGFLLSACYAQYVLEYINLHGSASKWYARVPIAVALVAFILVVVQMFNHMYFSFDEEGHYQRGALFLMDTAFVLIITLCAIVMIVANRKALNGSDLFPLLSYCILPVLAIGLQIFIPQITFVLLATTLSLFIIYSMIQVEYTRRLKEAEMALSNAGLRIAMSQIQPHFTYNALASIAQLCTIDPKAAQRATVDFSNYLRGNLDSANSTEPIPFSMELEHLNHYLSIEKLRFEERLNVEFDIGTIEFFIPALTVQPLVENAIKHGICKRPDGGTVKVSSREEEKAFVVTVEDDGVGFEKGDAPDGGGAHIGIDNVRQRLQAMVRGELLLESEKGKGTRATITIPKAEGLN